MRAHYLHKIPFAQALRAQEETFLAASAGGEGAILGFESEPVVTLGKRSSMSLDLNGSSEEIASGGFDLLRVDRGGQATIHNPGQLVIFPVVDIGDRGVRGWVCDLAKISRTCLQDFGVPAEWDEARPGLYTARGKIASIGVRVRQGVSTHGVAINVSNRLLDFQMIQACGVRGAAMDRVGDYPGHAELELEQVFHSWVEHFRALRS